jgi:hypothetical protein
MNDLLCEANVGFSALGFNVVEQDRLSVAGSFSEPDVSRYDGPKDLVSKERLQIRHDLIGKIGPLIKHRQEDAFDFEARIRRLPDLVYRLDEL